MKSAFVFFHNLSCPFDGEYFQNIIEDFNDAGLTINTVEILSDNDDLGFKRRILDLKDMYDNVVVFGGDSVNFGLNQIIAQTFDTSFVENENAMAFLQAVSKQNKIEYPEEYGYLPMESSVIPNLNGGYQGFILDSEDLTISLLPLSYEQNKIMYQKYVLPYLQNKLGIKKSKITLKYFGEIEILQKAIDEAQNIGEKPFDWVIKEEDGDVFVYLSFDFDIDEQTKEQIIDYIKSNTKGGVYAECDIDLGQALFEMLRLKEVKLSVAESFTGGAVVGEVIKNSGASAYVNEGVVTYSNKSKMKRLNVQLNDLQSQGAVSAIVAYQMAAGLLKDCDCDIAISTTGIAGPKSDDTLKPVGLCYIAVGMKDGVYTYKYNFCGNRQQITQRAKNTALFLAIKKLKLYRGKNNG